MNICNGPQVAFVADMYEKGHLSIPIYLATITEIKIIINALHKSFHKQCNNCLNK